MIPPGDAVKLRQPFGHFGLLMPLNQETKKGVTMLAGVIDPDCQKKLNCYSTMEVSEYVWNTGDFLGSLSIAMPCD